VLRSLRSSILALATLGALAGCAHDPAPARLAEPTPPPPPPADPLAEGLPADTLLYARLDLARALAGIEEGLIFVHPEAGREVAAQASRLWRAARQMMARRGFSPALAEHLFEAVLHLVVLADGEVESGAAVGLLLETEPALAEGLLRDLRALLEREAKDQATPYSLLEAPPGELIQLTAEPRLFVGRLGRYVLLSDVRSPRLWAALQGPAAVPLAGTELYGRFGRARPAFFFHGSIRGMLDASERQVERQLQALPGATTSQEGLDPQLVADGLRLALEAQRKLRRDLSLDSLDTFGGWLTAELQGDSFRTRAEAEALLAGAPGRLLGLLLDSGRAFVSPGPVPLGALTLLWRADPLGLLDESLAVAGPEAAQRFQDEVDAPAQARTGLSVRALLGLLAGDVCVFYDPPPTPEPGAPPEQALAGMAAYPSFLLGIRDRAAAAQALAALYEAGAKEPMLGPNLSREQLLGVELLVLNPGGGPSREYALAVALLERHLAAGSYNAVADLARRSREGGDAGPLGALLDSRPGANLVVAMSDRFTRWLEALGKIGDGPAPLDQVREEIRSLDLTAEEPDTAREVKESLSRLVDQLELLSQAQERMSILPTVLDGSAGPGRYHLEVQGELRRPVTPAGVP